MVQQQILQDTAEAVYGMVIVLKKLGRLGECVTIVLSHGMVGCNMQIARRNVRAVDGRLGKLGSGCIV